MLRGPYDIVMATDFENAVEAITHGPGSGRSGMNWLSTRRGTVYVEGQGIPAEYGVGRSGDQYVFIIVDGDEPTETWVKAAGLRSAIEGAKSAYASQPRRLFKRAMGRTMDSTLGPLGVFVKKDTLILDFPTTMDLIRSFAGRYRGTQAVESRYNLNLRDFKALLDWCDRHPQPTLDEREAGAYAAVS